MGPSTPKNEPIVDPKGVLSLKTASQATTRSDCRLGPVIRGLLIRAVLWSLAFGVAHVLGFRAYTSFLSGTGSFAILERLFGVAYLMLYAGSVLLVPVLVIAAGLLKGAALTRGLWIRTKKPEGSSNNGLQPTS